ncbi:hypothetical protein [Nocardia sp. XZ_19_385]|nr:hypothetical protein [Nocardia sp. XZ_19_385]
MFGISGATLTVSRVLLLLVKELVSIGALADDVTKAILGVYQVQNEAAKA